jgi:hypothetical protein
MQAASSIEKLKSINQRLASESSQHENSSYLSLHHAAQTRRSPF